MYAVETVEKVLVLIERRRLGWGVNETNDLDKESCADRTRVGRGSMNDN